MKVWFAQQKMDNRQIAHVWNDVMCLYATYRISLVCQYSPCGHP